MSHTSFATTTRGLNRDLPPMRLYEKAKKLVKLVFDKCQNSDIQVIVTSNDSFLMDAVDTKYWNILKRNGKTVTAINNNNSKDLFRRFRLTGLSNFDLFSSDFIQQQTQ